MRWLFVLVALTACHRAHGDARGTMIEVRASWPGASPTEIANSVTAPLEHALGVLPKITKLTSESRAGQSAIQITFSNDDVAAAQQAVQAALNKAISTLPTDMPSPPIFMTSQPETVARFLVPKQDAERAAQRLAELPGAGNVATCGDEPPQIAVDVDAQRLLAYRLAMADVVAALRNPDGQRGQWDLKQRAVSDERRELPDLVIATRNGVPVRLRDVATVVDAIAPLNCKVVAQTPGVAELAVAAQTSSALETLRPALQTALAPFRAIAVPRGNEVHGQFEIDIDANKVAAEIRQALAAITTPYDVEVRQDRVTVRAGGPAVTAELRKLPFIRSIGEPTAIVHLSAVDSGALAKTANAVAERLRQRGMLVTMQGLATSLVAHVELDRNAAARLGVKSDDVFGALRSTTGITATTLYGQTTMTPVVAYLKDGQAPAQLDSLFVRSSSGELVPLSAVAKRQAVSEQSVVLHRNQLSAVDLEVHGDPHELLKDLGADVRVEVEPLAE